MLEHYLIEHCSPTLASLKTGSLFSLSCTTEQALSLQLTEWNLRLSPKGVAIDLMRGGDRALIYVYRKNQLERDLRQPGVREFLAGAGYRYDSAGQAVEQLRARLKGGGGFPHEIGLFLGYPLCDVTGFIENRGRCCRLCGCWKVYGDIGAARRCFERFRRCSAIYSRLHEAGRSVVDLTVAA